MKSYGMAAAAEFLGDRIVYRNLEPLDPQVPGLKTSHSKVGLPAGLIPRKHELDYARLVAHLLMEARRLDAPGASIKRLLFLGDSEMLDGLAFSNLCQVGGWPGLAFIGAENPSPTEICEKVLASDHSLYLANRWSALADFDRRRAAAGLPVDESTAVVIDMDKTILGARGRNSALIDQSRAQAMQDTIAEILGETFDQSQFHQVYKTFNQSEFHPFTSDNQDYLAYIVLMIMAGVEAEQALAGAVRAGQMATFTQFISTVDARRSDLPAHIKDLHCGVFTCVTAGDPTPFKVFRRHEYMVTVSRMGTLADDASTADLLAKEIVLTQEVRQFANAWRQQGALLFGLSDKPDEASIPTTELAVHGYRALHQTQTHAVGQGR